MGQQEIRSVADDDEIRAFTQAMLDDLAALEMMLDKGMFESGIQRVGVEQEMALVGADCRPATAALDLLELLDDDRFTTELALFNLEANLPPQPFSGRFLRHMEEELSEIVQRVDTAGQSRQVQAVLTGILPTLRRSDLTLDSITPKPRYYQLNDAMLALGDGRFHIFIRGVDELELRPESVMFEAANTSFQLHLQVSPETAAAQYNLAQLITAPLLAAAVNSPLFLGKRLWHETRVALFERSVDSRSQAARSRGHIPRVHLGTQWLKHSVLELFQDAAARFPVALTCDTGPSALRQVQQGIPPELSALLLHNGTVWRWNRVCYGAVDGVAHLRIENRVLPAGPTVLDEVANAALFYGLMASMKDMAASIPQRLDFDEARGNFVKAARQGLGANLTWFDNQRLSARDLLQQELLPMARQGLADSEVPDEDIERYLGTLEERIHSNRTGSRWIIDGFAALESTMPSPEDAAARLVDIMLRRMRSGEAVHKWAAPDLERTSSRPFLYRTVADVMSDDLFTVRPRDVIDLAARMMHWKHFRHVPVESRDGTLRGLISHRTLLQLHHVRTTQGDGPVAVEDIMDSEPLTVSPETPFDEAMDLILHGSHACLLVVDDGNLVGIATERDFLRAVAAMRHPPETSA